jgi:hypothetical protein
MDIFENRIPRGIEELVGDFLRETAALVFVFPIFDKIVLGHHVAFWWIFWTFALAIGLLVLGIALERGTSGWKTTRRL